MATLRSLITTLLFISTANAHFTLTQPPSLEGDNFNEAAEDNAPCGGGTPDLSSNTLTDFHVDGESVQVFLSHPQANYLFRATLDSSASGNWTQLFPIVQQSGRGNFCEPAVTAPRDWVGKRGFLGIACNAPDGMLYQCAAVNFVSGSGTSSACTNGSAVSASFTDDSTLSALVGGSSSTGGASSTSSSNPASTSSHNAAPSLLAHAGGLPIGTMAVTAVMILLGAALL
ncbi:hypothetical protein C8A03DRAFT_44149 [Achaetomium macrosporum]|uniref:Copper acquisition factor BIM1-like domain-containing protein n=1 Tax=Achaetomium macrosporum TaxID=79813 RepID=A0AAN7CA10_9PEZI|nr:hypothetical protein C8A03DRAFT_44149 [Achaetomium macrosporum]